MKENQRLGSAVMPRADEVACLSGPEAASGSDRTLSLTHQEACAFTSHTPLSDQSYLVNAMAHCLRARTSLASIGSR